MTADVSIRKRVCTTRFVLLADAHHMAGGWSELVPWHAHASANITLVVLSPPDCAQDRTYPGVQAMCCHQLHIR